MRMGHLVQVDIALPGGAARFWMDSCAGRDQVARTVLQSGWAAYEAPLPALIAAWCRRLRPAVIDVGANTGFYSLLAAVTGAAAVHAFEPVAEIAEVLAANLRSSEAADRVVLHRVALDEREGTAALYLPLAGHGLVETSASLERGFRASHSEVREIAVGRLDRLLSPGPWRGRPVVMKLDVETHEPAVLRGATEWLAAVRPAIVCEVLPEVDRAALTAPLAAAGYRHFALVADGAPDRPRLVETPGVVPDHRHRDHVFLPADAAPWLAALTPVRALG